jgi:hypothetical protein
VDDEELITRRRIVRRRHPPDLPEGFPVFEHSPWTFEGRVEQAAAFARGLRREGPNRRWARWMYWTGWLVAAAFLLPMVIGVLQLVF